MIERHPQVATGFDDNFNMVPLDQASMVKVVDGENMLFLVPTTPKRATDEDIGHAFRGNQYTAGESGGGEAKTLPPHPEAAHKLPPIHEIRQRLREAEATAKALPETHHINTPERQQMRRDIAEDLYNKNIHERQHNRQATIITGLPAAGKSTLANPILKQQGALLIDPDEAKALLPEYHNGLGAMATHEESSVITKDILQRALAHGDNFVWPRVNSPEKVIKDIENLHKQGYTVHLKHLEVSTREATHSALSRFIKTGRYVPVRLIQNFSTMPRDTYEKGKAVADTHEFFVRDPKGGVKLIHDAPSDLTEEELQSIFADGVNADEYAGKISGGEYMLSEVLEDRARDHRRRDEDDLGDYDDDDYYRDSLRDEDVGHEFRGNQYVAGESGGGQSKPPEASRTIRGHMEEYNRLVQVANRMNKQMRTQTNMRVSNEEAARRVGQLRERLAHAKASATGKTVEAARARVSTMAANKAERARQAAQAIRAHRGMARASRAAVAASTPAPTATAPLPAGFEVREGAHGSSQPAWFEIVGPAHPTGGNRYATGNTREQTIAAFHALRIQHMPNATSGEITRAAQRLATAGPSTQGSVTTPSELLQRYIERGWIGQEGVAISRRAGISEDQIVQEANKRLPVGARLAAAMGVSDPNNLGSGSIDRGVRSGAITVEEGRTYALGRGWPTSEPSGYRTAAQMRAAREAAAQGAAIPDVTQAGNKVSKPADFEKDGVKLALNSLTSFEKNQFYTDFADKTGGMTPGEFKTQFTGGIPLKSFIIQPSSGDGDWHVNGEIQNAQGRQIGSFTRQIMWEANKAYSAYFKINEGEQGGGIGKKLLAANVAMYQKFGLKSVSVSANIDVGGYAWAKYGYVPKQYSWDSIRRSLSSRIQDMVQRQGSSTEGYVPKINNKPLDDQSIHELQDILRRDNPKAMWALADSKWGKDVLLNSSWSGVIDFSDKDTMQRFTAYIAKKKDAQQ